MRVPGLLIFLAIISTPILARSQQCPATPDLGPDTRAYRGRYDNRAYGFATTIPRQYVALDSDSPDYQRGFTIALPPKQGFVVVFAESNSADFGNVGEAAEAGVSLLRQRANRVENVQFANVRLSSASAKKVSAVFSCKGSTSQLGFVSIFALSKDQRFVYTLTWEGPLSAQAAAEQLIGDIEASWRLFGPAN